MDLFRAEKDRKEEVTFTCPIPPSVNGLYYNRRNGSKVLTKNAQDFIRCARAIINVAIEDQGWKLPERTAWLYVDVVVHMPDRKVRDSHNMLKIIMDVMQGLIYQNDYFVMPRIQSVEYDKVNPRINVKVSYQTKKERKKVLSSV